MSEITETSQRPDIDIVSDIEHLISVYPPLANDRHAFKVLSHAGVVTVFGHVQTPIIRRYFLDHATEIPGVVAVDAEQFYDDQSIRLDIARVLPAGVQVARVRFGVVILTGDLPHTMTLDQLVEMIRKVPGVVQVVSGFGG